MRKTNIAPIVATVVMGLIVVLLVISVGMSISNATEVVDDNGNVVLTEEEAIENLAKSISRVKVTENHAPKGTISFENTDAYVELPPIDTSYPLVVTPRNKDITVEIFVSPEKAGTGIDGWMRELAEDFNKENHDYNGKSIGIALRSMSSGTQIEYIESNVYVPDAISPSASMWGEMLDFAGISTITVNDRLVGNVAGILIDKSTYDSLESTYGSADIKAVVAATEAGTITAGYTNPFSSTSGLNFLASTLYSYDASNPLSTTAIDGFNKFQNNVPFVAYNTMQMRSATENNTFTSFILEYQTYINNSEIANNYEFIPYGIRHDNPLYAMPNISDEKLNALKIFNEYCMSASAQKSASKYGFNNLDDYVSTIPETDGNTWSQMQKVWKKNKNTAKPIAAVFVLDTSGSMSGEPINALKTSLTNSMKYINSTNYVGLVSYASKVNVDLPIGLFDLNQQSYFMGAVSGLNATGGTATYSALAQAVSMLNDFTATNPNVQPMIFLLSDGEQNEGASFKDIEGCINYYAIPIYTIGYNANLDELKKVSSINEAASIDADNDDVVYQLKNLFNANL